MTTVDLYDDPQVQEVVLEWLKNNGLPSEHVIQVEFDSDEVRIISYASPITSTPVTNVDRVQIV